MLRQYWVKLSSLEYGKFRRLDPCTKADEMFYSCETERSVQRFISHSSSRKVVFLTACLLVVGMASQKKLWTSAFVTNVDFLSALLEWVGDSKICSQNASEIFIFINYFEENEILQQKKMFFVISAHRFAVRAPCRAERISKRVSFIGRFGHK